MNKLPGGNNIYINQEVMRTAMEHYLKMVLFQEDVKFSIKRVRKDMEDRQPGDTFIVELWDGGDDA